MTQKGHLNLVTDYRQICLWNFQNKYNEKFQLVYNVKRMILQQQKIECFLHGSNDCMKEKKRKSLHIFISYAWTDSIWNI